MTEKISCLRFPAVLDKLTEVQNFVHKSTPADCKKLNSKLDLVLEELFVNVVNYAYPDTKGDVEIACVFKNDPERKMRQFSLFLRDWGLPFNPLDQALPPLDDDLDDRQIGGLGIFFVTQMADKCTYNRQNDTNEIRVDFNID